MLPRLRLGECQNEVNWSLDLNFERNSKVTLKASNPTSRVRVLGAGSGDHRPGSLSAAHLVQNRHCVVRVSCWPLNNFGVPYWSVSSAVYSVHMTARSCSLRTALSLALSGERVGWGFAVAAA